LHTTINDNTTKEESSISWDSPPPSSFSSGVKLVAESIARKEIEVIQQQFNTHSTLIQQLNNVKLGKNAYNQDVEINLEPQEFSQQTTSKEGEREGVEQAQLDDVLQTEPIPNSSTTTEDTSSQTNSFDPTSQQEAFQQKYRPVEVLNSDGKWVKGYWVHKCIVVGNLEGVERKYALVDECGDKYVFWGEIRVPRVG
jgi:hypothetical protein